MDLTTSIVGLQAAKTMARVQIRAAQMLMRLPAGSGGAAAAKLIDAADQSVSQAGDALVAEATGLGGQVDLYA